MSYPVLFLDFDGVMHPDRCEVDQLFCKLELLEVWLRNRPSVQVVVSSSWRVVHPIDEIRSYFSDDLQSRVLGVTPVFNQRPTPIDERHHEILHWLRARPGEVYRWAILDDQCDRFPPGHPRLVVTDGLIGLTAADLLRVDHILDLTPSETT